MRTEFIPHTGCTTNEIKSTLPRLRDWTMYECGLHRHPHMIAVREAVGDAALAMWQSLVELGRQGNPQGHIEGDLARICDNLGSDFRTKYAARGAELARIALEMLSNYGWIRVNDYSVTILKHAEYHKFCGLDAAASTKEAERLAPWAAVVADVDGGWMAYESWDDYETAQRQK